MKDLIYKKIQIGSSNEASAQDVIVLHGIGADENSLIPFIKQLNIPGNYFFIRGPYSYGPSGFSFFEVEFSANGPVHNKAQAKVSIDRINQWIIDQKDSGMIKSNSKICMMGFSQGAIMSYATALAHPDNIDKIIGLNGRVLKEVEAKRPSNNKKRIKIYAFYGLYDDIQPIHFAHEARARLNLDWVDLTYLEGECGHEITQESAEFVALALADH